MFELKIEQNPVHVRACGFGGKDYRPLDPIPVLQLLIKENNQTRAATYNEAKGMICLAVLVSSDTRAAVGLAKSKSRGAQIVCRLSYY